MHTELLKADPARQEAPALARAAQLLNSSELVAFPTETVYGVGAKVFDERAVKKIFAVKGRQAGQALLVHITRTEQLAGIAGHISSDARRLMDEFWPGPLSIIIPAHPNLSELVTGGNTTVGLRMPSHPLARKLIAKTGPLAATSANLSGRPSPLTAEHVKADLCGKIAAIMEGGPALQGIESTIIDMSQEPYLILRRGSVAVSALAKVLGKQLNVKPASMKQHYKTGFILEVAQDSQDFQCRLQKHRGQPLGIIYFDQGERMPAAPAGNIKAEYILSCSESGSEFFSILRAAEQKNLAVLLMAPLPDSVTESLRDRIDRAAAVSDKGDC